MGTHADGYYCASEGLVESVMDVLGSDPVSMHNLKVKGLLDGTEYERRLWAKQMSDADYMVQNQRLGRTMSASHG